MAPRYFSGFEGRSAMSLCAQSALPLAISFQGSESLITPSKHSIGTQVTESALATNIPQLTEFRGMFAIRDDEC